MNLVFVDACRDNPLQKRLRLSVSGLAGFQAPIGTLIAFSTAPGRVALDGEGDHSPYASAFAKTLVERPRSIEDALKTTRERVYEQTRQAQVPWETSSLVGEFLVAAGARSMPNDVRIGDWATSISRKRVQNVPGPDASQRNGRLAYFVEWKYLGGESGATPLGADSYAEFVDYYGRNSVPRSEVMRDKVRYYKRWPNRRYRMFRETLTMRELSSGLFEVFFEYSFDVESDTRRSVGRGNASLLLQERRNDYMVLREAGDVLVREITELGKPPAR